MEKRKHEYEQDTKLKEVTMEMEEYEFLISSFKHEAAIFKGLVEDSQKGYDLQILGSMPSFRNRVENLKYLANQLTKPGVLSSGESIAPNAWKLSEVYKMKFSMRDYSKIRTKVRTIKYNSFTKRSGFHIPHAIVISPGDQIFVCDTGYDRIQVFNSLGGFEYSFGSSGDQPGQFKGPMAITLDHTKEFLLIVEWSNHRVQICDFNGNMIRMFGSKGNGDGQFNGPRGIACDLQGNIYVADSENHRIQVFDQHGLFLRKFGTRGQGTEPFGIDLLATGQIVVCEPYQKRLSMFDLMGNFIRHVTFERFKEPRHVCVDFFGRILVSDFQTDEIYVFSSEGEYITCFGQKSLYGPRGLTVSRGQLVLVTHRDEFVIF